MAIITTQQAARPRGLPAVWRGNPWLAFAVRRLGRLLVSLWVLLTATFLMIHLIPGDPIRAALGTTAPQEIVDARRDALGLDHPLHTQYLDYVKGVFSGDLGTSIVTNLPVAQTIQERLPSTLVLAFLSFLVVAIVAVPLGVVMAATTRGGRRRGAELGFTSTSVFLAAIPEFLLAVALVYVFAVRLGWLPVASRSDASSYVLPVIALSLGPAAVMARLIRVEMLSVLGNDYIRTARAKRLPRRLVYMRHALPNALTATLTMAGLMLTSMVVGTVLIENVFAWPGLGSTIVQSILQKDYPVVQGVVLVYGCGVLFINLLIDVILAILDPRSTIRES